MPIGNNILAGSSAQGGATADVGHTIEQSVRFQGTERLVSSNSYDGSTYTFACWYKRGDDPTGTGLDTLFALQGNFSYQFVEPSRSAIGVPHGLCVRNGSSLPAMADGIMPDYGAWYHICISVSSGTVTTYINGLKQSTSPSAPTGSSDMCVGSNATNVQDEALVGYLAEVNFLDGTAMTDTNGVLDKFGRVNDDGIWVPVELDFSSNDYGAKGFRLTFSNNSDPGEDSAPTGGNHASANNLAVTGFDKNALSASNEDNDVDYRDTPTNNHGVLLHVENGVEKLTEANLSTKSLDTVTTADHYPVIEVSQPFLVEMFDQTPSAGVGNPGVLKLVTPDGEQEHTVIPALSTPDQIGYAIDIDKRATYAYDITNDTWLNGSTGVTNANVNSGNTQAQLTWTTGQLPTKDRYLIKVTGNQGSVNTSANRYNFGQRPYLMDEPSGFVAPNSNNLPNVTIKDPEKHFKAEVYNTGGSTGHTSTTIDFKPDLVWIKRTDGGTDGAIFDSVRGVHKGLIPSSANGEFDESDTLTAFNVSGGNGFTVSSDTRVGTNNVNYVAWCWKCPNSWDSTDSDITAGTIASSGKRNVTAGMSIVSYTANTDNTTVAHGLGGKPECIIFKRSDNTANWAVYHHSLGNDRRLTLNSSGSASSAGDDIFNETDPTEHVFSVKDSDVNTTGEEMIAYCWRGIEGYSKFGKYTGHSNSGTDLDGDYVHLGFTPALLMIKNTSAGANWVMIDNQRATHNPRKASLAANVNDDQETLDNGVSFLSNGFKVRQGGGQLGDSGNVFVYMAWAEHPFGGANVAPLTGSN